MGDVVTNARPGIYTTGKRQAGMKLYFWLAVAQYTRALALQCNCTFPVQGPILDPLKAAAAALFLGFNLIRLSGYSYMTPRDPDIHTLSEQLGLELECLGGVPKTTKN